MRNMNIFFLLNLMWNGIFLLELEILARADRDDFSSDVFQATFSSLSIVQ